MPLGVEFAGGTVVIVQFEQPADRSAGPRARSTAPAAARTPSSRRYGDPAQHQVMIRVPQVGAEVGRRRSARRPTQSRRSTAGWPSAATSADVQRVVGTEIVGPTVGTRADQQGHLGDGARRSLGILAYIAFRFQFSFAVGAVVATIHDLLVTLAFLAFFSYDLTLNVIAALLTITGYSTNDTIVIFDRVRENLRGMRRDSARPRHQRRGQPDAGPDDHHRRHGAAVGRSRCSSSAARCCTASPSR